MDLSRCCRYWLVHPNLAFHPATERKWIFSNGKGIMNQMYCHSKDGTNDGLIRN